MSLVDLARTGSGISALGLRNTRWRLRVLALFAAIFYMYNAFDT